MKTIEVECPSCHGTGLIVGCSERGGAAVVCSVCKGTGKVEYSYNDFTGKKVREGVNRVFESSFGYIHTDIDVITKEGKLIRFSEGGCTYQEWLNGEQPKPVKDLYCPYQYRNRGVGNEPLDRCKENCGFGFIKDCRCWEHKEECWQLYDKISQ